ncbi:hypothetical protein [Paenibacillus cremeus]|uniref:Uncharacterized protein n=1 Tax=Paenibacillus cremeus TaxID=2163881 RepID=A0A559KCN2_9BACL|nr:hypothetical protein [Paenibacillus cremeus]TVY09849.1 hypothetical protein FPZ49_10780 [Paenibacillus cremeus]
MIKLDYQLIKTTETIERIYLPVSFEAKKARSLYGALEKSFAMAFDHWSDLDIQTHEYPVLHLFYNGIEESGVLNGESESCSINLEATYAKTFIEFIIKWIGLCSEGANVLGMDEGELEVVFGLLGTIDQSNIMHYA